MKKIVLTGVIALFAAASAFAESFPNDGYMLENKTYDNSAIYDILGVYSGSVDAIAEYIDSSNICNRGEYLPHGSENCVVCPENSYCPGGEYTYSEDTDNGITPCTAGLFSPAGMWESAQCGHILHVGEYVVYLRSTPGTTNALGFQFDDGVFYANMTATDVPMHSGTTKQLKVGNSESSWSIYDDTVTVAN